MSAEAPLVNASFKVGARTATITVRKPVKGTAISMACEWSPDAPKTLTPQELAEYRAGRDAAFSAAGLRALIVEV
jgi:hypothetical protein